MKKNLLVLLVVFFSVGVYAQWKPAGDKLKTEWAEKMDVKNVLPEYPRPVMERADWANLNGLWEYAFLQF